MKETWKRSELEKAHADAVKAKAFSTASKIRRVLADLYRRHKTKIELPINFL